MVVEPLTAEPAQVFVTGRQLIAGSAKGEPTSPQMQLRIEMAEPFQGGYRVQFDAITDRNAADRWRNRYVLAPRDELPEPHEGEIYLHDLVGLAVEVDGRPIGTVQAYYELPHDIMIEVARDGGAVMVPYRFVTSIELDARRIVIEPPEGLL